MFMCDFVNNYRIPSAFPTSLHTSLLQSHWFNHLYSSPSLPFIFFVVTVFQHFLLILSYMFQTMNMMWRGKRICKACIRSSVAGSFEFIEYNSSSRIWLHVLSVIPKCLHACLISIPCKCWLQLREPPPTAHRWPQQLHSLQQSGCCSCVSLRSQIKLRSMAQKEFLSHGNSSGRHFSVVMCINIWLKVRSHIC